MVPRLLAAHHEGCLGVHLEAGQAVDHDGARLLEAGGPGDVALLVEAGLHLDEDGYLLAVARRPREGPHDGRVARGAVEGHLDREDGRVHGGLVEEVDDGIEGLVGKVEELVLPPDLVPDRDALRGRGDADGRPGLEFQALDAGEGGGALALGELEEILELEGTIHRVEIFMLEAEARPDALGEGLGVRRDAEAHRIGILPVGEDLLHRGEEVDVAVLVHADVRVAGHLEEEALPDSVAGEEAGAEGGHNVVDEGEAETRALRGKADEPLKVGRHLDEGEDLLPRIFAMRASDIVAGDILASRILASRILASEEKGRVDAQVARRGEDVLPVLSGLHAQGGEGGSDALGEVALEPTALGGAPARGAHDGEALVGEGGEYLPEEAVVLSAHDLADPLGYGGEGFGGGEPGRVALDLARTGPGLERGHAHHEELVEIRGHDDEELEPLEEGRALIEGLLQDAGVELYPGELPVEEKLRCHAKPLDQHGLEPERVFEHIALLRERESLEREVERRARPPAPPP